MLFKSLIILAVILIAGEILCRKLGAIYRTPWEQILNKACFSPRYGWKWPANVTEYTRNPDGGDHIAYRYNSHGWCDVEHSRKKPEGVVRILVIGDSFTQGVVKFEKLYTRQMERLFQSAGYDVEVISMGIVGWATDQQLLALKHEGVQYSPDIVISQFCSNDLAENMPINDVPFGNKARALKPITFFLKEGKLVQRKVDPETIIRRYNPLKSRIAGVIFSSALVYNLCSIFYSFGREEQPAMDGTVPNWGEKYPLMPDLYSENAPEWVAKAWELYSALIRETKKVAENHNALFFVLSVSGNEGEREWNLRWKRFYRDENGSEWVTWKGEKIAIDYMYFRRRWKRAVEDAGATCIPTRRKHERYKFDAHTNEAGNLTMARDIVDFLLENTEARSLLCVNNK